MLKDLYFVAAGETDMCGKLLPGVQKKMQTIESVIKKQTANRKNHSTYVIYLDNGFCESSCNVVCGNIEMPISFIKMNKNQMSDLISNFTGKLLYDYNTVGINRGFGNCTLIIVANKEFYNELFEKYSKIQDFTLGQLPLFLMEYATFFHIGYPDPVFDSTYTKVKADK